MSKHGIKEMGQTNGKKNIILKIAIAVVLLIIVAITAFVIYTNITDKPL